MSDFYEANEIDNLDDKISDEIVIEIKPSKFLNVVLGLASTLCILSAIYINSLYIPRERSFDNDNLFCDNSLIIDSSAVESICVDLENEFDIDLDYNNENSLLLNAIYCNDNLSYEDKVFCIKYLDLFNDNPYLDKDRVYFSLLNLDISNKNRPPYYEDNVEGVYIDKFKSIGIFVEDDDNSVKAHELVHCVCANDGNLPVFFCEGMTELLANEYFSDNHFLELNNYPFEVFAVKMLCDAAGSDAVLRAFTVGDMSFVYESLASYYGDVSDAKKAIEILNATFLFRNNDSDEFSYTSDDISNYLFGYLNNVIYNKYENGNLERASFFYNEVMLLNLFESDIATSFMEDLEEYGILCNVYFSSKLREEYPNIVISNLDDTVVINKSDFQKIKLFQ